MKLGARPRCAIRMMWEISHLGGEERPVSLSAVSKRCHIPRNSLAPLALALRNRGLLEGVRGSRGGYRLGRPISQIGIGQILEASTGPLNIVDCVENPETCISSDCCECRRTYAFLNRRIKEVLDNVTLGQIRDPAWLWSKGTGCEATIEPIPAGASSARTR
ncbi:MAG: RrF2 family transcriptional regulator [Acidithiobacillales bacterium]